MSDVNFNEGVSMPQGMTVFNSQKVDTKTTDVFW